jgi:hypothetical protein
MPRPRLLALEDRLAPAIATWDGGGANNNWTTAANWVGDIAPQPGDDLVFPLGAAQTSNVNDFAAGTAFHSIGIRGNDYALSGNAIALAAGLTVDASTDVQLQIGLPVTLAADQTFTNIAGGYNFTGSIDLNGHALTVNIVISDTFAGPITGTGSLNLNGGNGNQVTAVNTFTGPTTVNESSLEVIGTIPGPVTVQTRFNESATLAGTGTVGPLTVTAGELFPGSLSNWTGAGTLHTGDLSVGPAAGTTFRVFATGSATSIAVTGTVQVGGRLDPFAVPGYQARPGDQFTVISNDGTDPVVGTFTDAPEGSFVGLDRGQFRITYHGGDGNDVVISALPAPGFAVGAGAGGMPQVNVYTAAGELIGSFLAYGSAFRGGVRVATADVTGDGFPDIVTGAGPGGGPHVKVYDGRNFAVVREFFAYDASFTGGVFVAASQITLIDTNADIITGAGAGGGPHVKVFDGGTGEILDSFMAYDLSFRGGVSVAGTDAYSIEHAGTSTGSIVTGPGPGGGADIRVFRGTTHELTLEFLAYDPAFRGGVNVASHGPFYSLYSGIIPPSAHILAGTIATAPASGGGPDVRLFNADREQVGEFLAYAPAFFGGVALGMQPSATGGGLSVLTGPGPGGGPHVKAFSQNNPPALLLSFLAFDPAFIGGVFVG